MMLFPESFYDAFEMTRDGIFDTSFGSSSPELTLDTWVPNNPDGFPEMTDLFYQANAWRDKSVGTWTTNDVLQFICTEATNHNRNYEDMKLQNFSDVTSETFRDMSLDDFVRLSESSEDGQLLYKSKEALLKNHQFGYIMNHNEITHHRASLPTCPEQRLSRLSCSSTESSTFEPAPRKRPGRPRSSHTIRRKPAKRMGKLWEFLRNLLLDDKTCPSLIKWDDHTEGTFKFVQSEKVAQLWGNRKKNEKMNYEKLSRAMRYYYRSKVLLPVAGKRLVYKFGPQATGWRTDNPILENRVDLQV